MTSADRTVSLLLTPCLGDNGKLYTNFDKEMIIEMRRLILKPMSLPQSNRTVLSAGQTLQSRNSDEELKAYLHELSDKGPETVIITSIPGTRRPTKDFSIRL